MCDAINEKDERYKYASELMDKDGCKQVNLELTQCLKQYKKDWRMCKDQTANLQKCLIEQKNQRPK
ncbi:unnamed protein product [Paramecium octaurelia]|uniref:Uncharacterized protein n=1 Tax=Paramecium octaurelia TaxID=43137 RepID=A0A8S1XPN4_PAROT|nr:unnamed protein product [Paramecium octaurelia]